MAQKGKASSKTTVRRIKANDDAPKKEKTVAKKTNRPTKVVAKTAKKSSEHGTLIGYFKGAWAELKLVRWPTRSATWAMTAAVLIFTLAFVVLILLLDAAFNWGFNQFLK
ncbi:preprotein translocase subunit SecE [Candidatus Nanosynbacter sp. TM7-074]|uniref:Protein translocase subunit SecE n=1 Tax=Candidatus Nanosynbacter sp. TM7-074 TaxID=3158573 RepID=A0AB39J9P2_9BACT